MLDGNGVTRCNRPTAAVEADASPVRYLNRQTIMLKQALDGFSYNTQLLFLPNRYFPNALAQLDLIRRAANLRARWFAIPDQIDEPIAPFDTTYYQFEVSGGSYIWGYQFSSLTAIAPDGRGTETAATDLLVQVVDSCTGIPFFQDYANAGGVHSNFTARAVPILLTQPRLILDPGLVNVAIANRTPNSITCQLLIHAAEPCRVITEEGRQVEWLDMLRDQIARGRRRP